MSDRKPVECWLTAMDGVLVHEEEAIPGASEFIQRLVALERRFLLLTNNSIYTPRDLRARLARSGIEVPEEVIWTSALATAACAATAASTTFRRAMARSPGGVRNSTSTSPPARSRSV